MKLNTLNTWGGRIKEPFINFIKDNQEIDIFCFQEIYDQAREIMEEAYPIDMFDQFSDLKILLPNHNGYFRPVLQGVYGIAIFVKKDIPVSEENELIIHASASDLVTDGHHSRNMQWIKINLDGRNFTVMNVHGLWNGKGKTDTPERLAQSRIIKEFMSKIEGSKILCGDFNLNPDTESVAILEEGMTNLVKEYSITSTRTSYYEKPGRFADYIFTSPDIKIRDFRVLPDEVSDHAPLYLEI
ncbi:MAG: hypothetical protein A2758_02310 [Candidatus Zambryskibacteria bacterium RIFCSPHIGHO2_01_FULL_49_18]|uniref:Endonuclease/exonuclease/phosphatase domain-containing protein n=2 Tax=Candidatus Zambryskiibacteriota TaxID=1817925 RepID=A0A1G2T1W7_9BACT|nr:MAG: hypothetical protein A2758_02310 [Candidatus Zambryskibacteria bacterium RIFCSPHIGHO2_01_FULL_49_18]OHB06157.1 MAG: hypothetical protein A3A26_01270 [Candidatus Zambryskibacteria bacterium RIFCSPLOWO2_01_FULL_47_14]